MQKHVHNKAKNLANFLKLGQKNVGWAPKNVGVALRNVDMAPQNVGEAPWKCWGAPSFLRVL